MNYCENCGKKLKKNAHFCEHCGQKVKKTEPVKQVETPTRATVQAPKKKEKVENKERKSFSKRQKLAVGSVIAILFLLFGAYQVGTVVYSQENQIEEMNETLLSKDSERIAEVIVSHNENFETTSENLERFVTYLEENPDYLEEMVSELNKQGSFDSLQIEETGKKLGLYPTYELVMTPVYGTIHINAKDVAVSLGDEELFVSDSENFTREVGPFTPGQFNFTGEGEGNGFPLITNEEATWLDVNDENKVNLELTGDYISVHSDLYFANVYLNDKKIGQLEDGYAEFGPIQATKDMKLHLVYEVGGQYFKSETTELTEGLTSYRFTDYTGYPIDDPINDLSDDQTNDSSDDLMSNQSENDTTSQSNEQDLGTESDAAQVLYDAYYTAYQLTTDYESYAENYNQYYDPSGPAYKDQRNSFLSFGQSVSEDDARERVEYDVSMNAIDRKDADSFDIDYEVTYTTYYADEDPRVRHYSKEATVKFKSNQQPLIYSIRNEKLIYEE